MSEAISEMVSCVAPNAINITPITHNQLGTQAQLIRLEVSGGIIAFILEDDDAENFAMSLLQSVASGKPKQ